VPAKQAQGPAFQPQYCKTATTTTIKSKLHCSLSVAICAHLLSSNPRTTIKKRERKMGGREGGREKEGEINFCKSFVNVLI
jgi:hypothetical protein